MSPTTYLSRHEEPRVRHHADPCGEDADAAPGCHRPALERLRFWNGRFLVARDLKHQQEDLIRRLEYHQSFAHGEGVLCGFEIRPHPRDDCRDHWIVVDPGMGYDCCGRTLWMSQTRVVQIPRPEPEDTEAPPANGAQPPAPPAEPEILPGRPPRAAVPVEEDAEVEAERERERDPQWFIVACYTECKVDPLPALYSEDLCEPVRNEHGRVREDVMITVVPASEVSESCWPRRRPIRPGDCSDPYEDDCGDRLGDSAPCNRACVCGECLILAGVWRDGRGRLRWSTTHRKRLGQTGNLTRITGVSWPHGGRISSDELLDEHDGKLIVRFSRRLRAAEGLKNGINRMTFTVSYLGSNKAYEEVEPPEEGERSNRPSTPRLSDNGRCAIFDLDPDDLRGSRRLAGSYVQVRLLCDFLVDCHGRCVSGAHLHGDVNGRGSGNDVQGGVFASWFYLSWRGGDR